MRNPTQPKNQKAKILTQIPGPKSRIVRESEDRFLAPGLQGFALMAGIVAESASGNLVYDIDGNAFLDIIGGIGVNGLGHSHPRWIKAVQDQAKNISVGSFTSMAREKLLQKVASHAPSPGVNRLQLYSSGSEAVESALRLAKCATKKTEFVSFWGGFHGKTMGALSLMGSDFKKDLGPMVSGSHIVPYANCYRCPFNLTYPSCGLACVEHLRKHLKTASTGNLAAIIIEPMQGTAGNIIPPDDFLPAIKEVAKENDALLICDEMITGFGRTGLYWGVSHSKVSPDIVTLGKQFGGGYPISGVLTTSQIASAKPWSNPSGSSSSYGGNALAAAAALESLTIIEEELLVENSKAVGDYLLNKLKSFEKYSFVGDVRGRGMFMAIEFVLDKKTKEAVPKHVCEKIFNACLQRGLLTMAYTSSFRIQPAMTLDEKTADEIYNILTDVMNLIENERWI